MKHLKLAIFLAITNAQLLYAQLDSTTRMYDEAYQEIAQMLDGKEKISIKRAVFLSEWAYLDGRLDYEKDFCIPVKNYANYLLRLIEVNKWEKYKTAKQIALCNFFFYPCYGNEHKPFEYDFSNEFPENDWRYQLVSRTLMTHKGRCHSLPWAFKLIAEELGAEVGIAHAPRHCFIMYEDKDNLFTGDWVTVEVTSHQYQPTFAIKDHFAITDSAINVGTYLTPLSDIQTVACQLSDLALSYFYKYHRYDEFILKCVKKSLAYYPMNPNAVIMNK